MLTSEVKPENFSIQHACHLDKFLCAPCKLSRCLSIVSTPASNSCSRIGRFVVTKTSRGWPLSRYTSLFLTLLQVSHNSDSFMAALQRNTTSFCGLHLSSNYGCCDLTTHEKSSQRSSLILMLALLFNGAATQHHDK